MLRDAISLLLLIHSIQIPSGCGDGTPKNIVFRIKTLTSNYEPEYAATTITHNGTFVTFTVDIRRRLSEPVMMRTLASIRVPGAAEAGNSNPMTGGNMAHKTVTNTTLDYCEFLRHPQFEPVANLLQSTINSDRRNHFYDRCPIAVGHYYVKDFTLDLSLLPSAVPRFDFTLHLEVLHGSAPLRLVYDLFATGQVGQERSAGGRRPRRKPPTSGR